VEDTNLTYRMCFHGKLGDNTGFPKFSPDLEGHVNAERIDTARVEPQKQD
jgi:hypothetical protein